jgi:NADP-dependent 3-hydroxy acid dehydrogenase YdfG
VFRQQGFGHVINTASTAAFRVVTNQSVYAGIKMAVRAISEGLRQEAGPDLRVTIVSPGITSSNQRRLTSARSSCVRPRRPD